jgi:hypothetical protein
MVTAVKRPAGETRGKVAAGPKRQATPPRQPPTLHPDLGRPVCPEQGGVPATKPPVNEVRRWRGVVPGSENDLAV